MQFYSFSFGEMKLAPSDGDRPPTLATELNFGFRADHDGPVQSISLRIRVPQDPGRDAGAMALDAYAAAGQLLRCAAELCETHTRHELEERTRSDEAIVLSERPE
jgi:hypothetical protein